ncbi:PAS domain S-box-containing protein [Mycoplana sp. BE70]|uniref:PAS domain S-box protein n=1 Tax=Mycoplana sp. BE70 TaxID=2817775 RepID=UPI00285E4494|nr:PAS domain S-box protein [Mycoplana sp. BE70]MDR6757007.1 PAS domain S-box-containing protein [Mycoplana sp. BE70]
MLNHLMAIPVPVYGTDTEGRITFFNEAAAALWGRRPVVGTERWCGSWKLFHGDGRPMQRNDCPMARVVRGEVVADEEMIAQRPDGSEVAFESHPNIVKDDTGKVIGAVNLLIELADSNGAEAADARLAAIVSSSDDAIIGKTLEGVITSWNTAATRILGYDAEEMIGQSIRKIIPADLQSEEDEILFRLKRGEHIRHFETVRIAKDGRLVELSITVSPTRDKRGRLVGASKVARDITERNRAALTSARLAAIVETSDDAIISKGLDSIVTSWNASATRMFGYRPEEMIGTSITRLIPPELRDEEDNILAKLRRGERIDHYDTVRITKDGTRIDVSLTISPIHDCKGRVVGASKIARDIGERKQHERLQRLLFDELNHRVKNTLAIIQSLARQSLRKSPSPERFVESFVGRIDALGRAHNLLVDRKMSGTTVEELVKNQVALGEREAQIAYRGPDVRLEARIAVQLGLVLHELATNARKYGALSTGTGHLDISWTVSDMAARVLRLRWCESGASQVAAPKTSGFGTTIIERSLLPYGGSAQLSYAGEGLSCEIEFPLPEERSSASDAAHASAQDQLKPTDLAFHRQPRVLIVEDEPLIAMEMEEVLRTNNFQVAATAFHLKRALQLAAGDEFDAVLLDANLGGARVDEVAELLAAKRIPFVFVSGYGREGLPARFRDFPLVSKPFDTKRLVAELTTALLARAPASSLGQAGKMPDAAAPPIPDS